MFKSVTLVVAVAVAIAADRPALAKEPRPWVLPPEVIYEDESKSKAGAFMLELVVAGAGSLYAGDTAGAVTTWMLLGVGTLALGWGVAESFDGFHGSGGSPDPLAGPAILAGMALVLGGRIYGLANAVRAVDRYNDGLCAHLGLGELSMAPVVAPNTGGLAVVGRF